MMSAKGPDATQPMPSAMVSADLHSSSMQAASHLRVFEPIITVNERQLMLQFSNRSSLMITDCCARALLHPMRPSREQR